MLFWRTRNYEKELESLSEEIKRARLNATKTRVNSRRYRSVYILYTLAAYLCFVAVEVSSKAYQTIQGKFYLAAVPVVIYLVYRLLSFVVWWRQDRATAHLEAIQLRRDGLIEEYKDKINYSQIQKVLSTGKDADSGAQKPTEKPKDADATSKKKQTKAPKVTLKPESAVLLEKARINKPSKAQKNVEWPAQKNQKPLGAPDLAPPMFVPPRTPVSAAPQTGSHSWMDRLADLVLGENETSPNSRYALICPVCHTHNGLASYGQEPKDVVYRCPFCGTMNGNPKNDSPKSELADDTPAADPIGSVAASPKNSPKKSPKKSPETSPQPEMQEKFK